MEELRLVVLTKNESEGAASLKLSHACIRVNFKKLPPRGRDLLQISFLILTKLKRINESLFSPKTVKKPMVNLW